MTNNKIGSGIVAAAAIGVALLVQANPSAAFASADDVSGSSGHPRTIHVDGGDIQSAIDAAVPHSVVIFDRNRQVTLAVPLKVTKPLTIRGLNARLPQKLSKTPLVVIQSEGVTVSDFELHGNGDTVPQVERAPLLVLQAGGFTVERGLFTNSSKDGILIDGGALAAADLTGGVVRDIVGRTIRRDLVSVGGSGSEGHRIRNILIDNVRCYNSQFRGTVEVSDGSENITVRKVYAEDCIYAIDVQDHGNPNQINRNVVIEDVYARNSRHAIRTASRPLGHTNLVLRNIVAERCIAPLEIKNIDNVTLHGVTILDHASPNPPVSVLNCDGLSIRDLTIKDDVSQAPALLMQDCSAVLVDNVTLRGKTGSISAAVCYRITADEAFSGLRIANVFAPRTESGIILLERKGTQGTLSDYVISGNIARVVDKIQGAHAVIANNTAPSANGKP
jgi:hypothetical protein